VFVLVSPKRTGKGRYEAHFISKVSDADMENAETQAWLEFAFGCKYISWQVYEELVNLSEQVGNLLNHMINYPEKYNDMLSFIFKKSDRSGNCLLQIANCKLPLAFCLLLIFFSCNTRQNNQAKTETTSEDIYTCSMHPEVLEHQPGNCPICGMKLIKKNATPVALNNLKLESLLKPTNEFVVSSLPVTTPRENSISIPVKAYGTIEYDARAAGAISARVSGRIERLYLRYRYQEVTAGQKVMDIYSPELVTAQQNLLFLLKSDPDNTSFITAAKQKLSLLGMSSEELNKVIQTGKPLYAVGVYSNYSGHVHNAGMSNEPAANEMSNSAPLTQELSLKEGMYVQKGQTLFMIMSHHMIWAALQIFTTDESLVKKGDTVTITPETNTSATIHGTIDFIEPFFRSNSKSITARVYFHNAAALPVGSKVTADIYTKNKNALWLPQTAVLSLGRNEVAFVKEDGGFIAHKITTGIRTNSDVQIISGLTPSDSVATNAQYLMDSESFIETASK
jgi:Cu(I)/Ag(I) efflux system membrane fusion protein